MENFIIYLIKVSGLLAVFYIAYHTLLRKETFFYSNRKFLLAGLITSTVLPLLVLTRTIWVEAAPQAAMQEMNVAQLMAMHEQMEANVAKSIDWYSIAGGIYVTGVLLFLIRFGIDIKAIVKMLQGKVVVRKNGFKYIDSETVQSPFSFFNYIVYNSKILSTQELHNILSHEKVHSAQKHSFDMIISQLFCIAFWFNPFVWAYRKAISQNLEFIADAEAAKEIEDITSYQKTLLKITVQPECTAIINHFYQSLIKKRIVMLNKKQSRLLNKWKYATVLPILALFMFAFQLEVRAQEKQKSQTESFLKTDSAKAELLINKDSKKEDLENEKDFFKEQFNIDLKFSGIKYNANKELTSIKVKAKGNGVKREYSVKTDDPIVPFAIVVEQKNGKNPEISFSPQTFTFTDSAKGHVYMKSNASTIITSDEDVTVITGNTTNSDDESEYVIKSINYSDDNTESKTGFWSVNNVKINDKDLLIVIDGKKQEKGETIQIPINRAIDEIKTLDKKEAKKKYGKDGKKGAIEITTKKDTDLRTGVIIKNDLNGSITENLKNYTGEGVIVIDEKGHKEGNYDRINNILIRTEQQLNDGEEILLKYSAEEQEEAKKAIKDARKEVESARKELTEKRIVIQQERAKILEERENRIKEMKETRAKQIEERNKIKNERAKQAEEWNKVKEEVKKAKEEN